MTTINSGQNGSTQLDLDGEYDLSHASQLEESIQGAGEAANGLIILDFTRCRFVDSTILGVLLRQYDALGPRMRFVVPKGSPVRRVLDLTNLTEQLRVIETVDDAFRMQAWSD